MGGDSSAQQKWTPKRAPILNRPVKGFVMVPVSYFPAFDNKHIKTNPEHPEQIELRKKITDNEQNEHNESIMRSENKN